MKCISVSSSAAKGFFVGGLLLTVAACGGGLEVTTDSQNSQSNSIMGNTSTQLPGWTLVWQDEFNTPGLPDSSKWVYDTEYNQRGWWNGELQYYSANRLENARVADGKLRNLARQVVKSQEDERAHLSRELHDSTSQTLVSAKLLIESAVLNVSNVASHPGKTLVGCSYSLDLPEEAPGDEAAPSAGSAPPASGAQPR